MEHREMLRYRPLGDAYTRIVEIALGSSDDEMVCYIYHKPKLNTSRLQHWLDTKKMRADLPPSCKEPFRYEPLSYTWGDSSSPRLIRCKYRSDDADTWISITQNCYAALFALRKVFGSRIVWIDAICINQADPIEKSAQVRNMYRIYTNSRRAVIYLHSATSQPSKLFEHQYFTRIWVLQEIWAADTFTVLHNDQTRDRKSLLEELTMEQSRAESERRPDLRKLQLLALLLKGTRTKPPLFELISLTAEYQSTDRRDKVIALLNMAGDLPLSIIAALTDYTEPFLTLSHRVGALLLLRSLGLDEYESDDPDRMRSSLDALGKISPGLLRDWLSHANTSVGVKNVSTAPANADELLAKVECLSETLREEALALWAQFLLHCYITREIWSEETDPRRLAITSSNTADGSQWRLALTASCLEENAGTKIYLVPKSTKRGDYITANRRRDCGMNVLRKGIVGSPQMIGRAVSAPEL